MTWLFDGDDNVFVLYYVSRKCKTKSYHMCKIQKSDRVRDSDTLCGLTDTYCEGVRTLLIQLKLSRDLRVR